MEKGWAIRILPPRDRGQGSCEGGKFAQELEGLRVQFGLEPSQKAELLREVASIAAWVISQAAHGRTVEARRGEVIEEFVHPTLRRLQAQSRQPEENRLGLSDGEVKRLAEILDRPFEATEGLRKALVNLSSTSRRAPKIRWPKDK